MNRTLAATSLFVSLSALSPNLLAFAAEDKHARSIYLFEDYSDEGGAGLAELSWSSNGTVTGVACTESGPLELQGTNHIEGVLELAYNGSSYVLRKDTFPIILHKITNDGLFNAVNVDGEAVPSGPVIVWGTDDETTGGIYFRKLLPEETSFQADVDSTLVSQLVTVNSPLSRKDLAKLAIDFSSFGDTIRIVFDTKNEQKLFDAIDDLRKYVTFAELPGCTASRSYVDLKNVPTDYIETLIEELVRLRLVTSVFPLTPADAGDGESALLSNLRLLGVVSVVEPSEISKRLLEVTTSFFDSSFASLTADGGVVEISPTRFKYLYDFKLIGKSDKLCHSNSDWERLSGVVDFRLTDISDPDELFYIRVEVKDAHYARSLLASSFNEASDFRRDIATTILLECISVQFEKRLIESKLVEVN